jgi:hypothetical protein
VDCILTRIRILTQDRFFCPDARIQLESLSRQKVVSRQKVLSRQKVVSRRKCILEKVYPARHTWLGALDLNISGKHSDQGSMTPGFHQDFRSRTKISGHSDRVFAQNFDAVLAVIVICAGDIIFAKFCQEV